MDIQNNIHRINKTIRELESRYHRISNAVTLLAITKKQSLETIQTAIDAGQRLFGENYLQEALPKIEHFAAIEPALEWHFVGPIQRNKTRKIAEHFAWVHSVDSMLIAERLNDQRPTHLPPLNICLQINVSHETSKSGIAVSDTLELARFCANLPHLRLRGLMAIPALQPTLPLQRQALHPLTVLFDELRQQGMNLDTLSMGMSDDLEAAIAEGATLVRIGTALFGNR